MIVYLLCEYVDQGYSVVSVHLSETIPTELAAAKNAKYRKDLLTHFMKTMNAEEAEKFVSYYSDEYFVVSYEVEQ